jgi:hypothetical protein
MTMDARTKLEIERKFQGGTALSGDKQGYIAPENLAYWQLLNSQKNATQGMDTGNQATGDGVGTVTPPPDAVTNYPGNDIVPSVTKDAATGYGYTGIVLAGVAFMAISMLSAFKRVRGR